MEQEDSQLPGAYLIVFIILRRWLWRPSWQGLILRTRSEMRFTSVLPVYNDPNFDSHQTHPLTKLKHAHFHTISSLFYYDI